MFAWSWLAALPVAAGLEPGVLATAVTVIAMTAPATLNASGTAHLPPK
jgi:hypothetical protein